MEQVTKLDSSPGTLTTSLKIVMGLLAVSVFINYIDRGNLSAAAPMVKDELKLSASRLGFLLSAFFWTYPIFQVFSGWLVDRFNVCWVMAIGFFVWSAATGVTGLLHSFAALLIVRFVLGAGESVAYPAYSRIMAQYIPDSYRGLGNALIASGLSSGPGFSMLAGGMLMARFGWRPFFVVLGTASLLWLVPWLIWMPRGPGTAPVTLAGPSPDIWEILRQRSAWGTFVALFCVNYVLYFMIVWLPFYLVRERHFSMDTMAKVGAAVFFTQAASAVICGRYSDRCIVRGATHTRVRKTALIVASTCAGVFLLASVVAGPALSVALLILVGVSVGVSASTIWPVTQKLAGPHASGRWTGLQCGVGNYAGVLASAVTGIIVDRTGRFYWAFTVTAAFSLAGALCWAYWLGPVEQVVWGTRKNVVAGLVASESA